MKFSKSFKQLIDVSAIDRVLSGDFDALYSAFVWSGPWFESKYLHQTTMEHRNVQ